MPAITCQERDLVARESIRTTTRITRGPTAPELSRRYLDSAMTGEPSADGLRDLALLTSELMSNAVENSGLGAIDMAVSRGRTFTRIAVSTPDASWTRAPESHAPVPGQTRGWGLFLVEELSDRWGTCDADCTVWFELDHPASPASDLWTVLQGIHYPARRTTIVAAAREALAPASAVTDLEALERESYAAADAVALELVDRRVESARPRSPRRYDGR